MHVSISLLCLQCIVIHYKVHIGTLYIRYIIDIRLTLVLWVHKNENVFFQFNSRKLAFVTGFKDILRNISRK